ncbi:FecR domain-containing protein [Ottowia thiooxydans]|uniref:FecR domain-containing protein n=1 Tax=Ottowia thiooxydans TaxID=219182 RepID=UPI000403D6EB|nr:FecR family protein [Ottowia thiooxydans]
MNAQPQASLLLPELQGPRITQAVSLQAAQWLVALQAADVNPEDQAAWKAWRAANPEHERAWQHIESFGTSLRELNLPLAHAALAGSDDKLRRSRRQAIKVLTIAAFAGTGAWWMRSSAPWGDWQTDHSTAIGERANVTLPDGTVIILNTRTAVDVRFDSTQRLVSLIRGEILITTAPDPQISHTGTARPFLVDTTEGRLRALGTRFAVRQHESRSQVSVFEGAVEIHPTSVSAPSMVLQAGQETFFTRHSAEAPHEAHALTATAWTTGMLVVHEMPLGDFIAELARYRPGRLNCAASIANLRVSGIYPVTDTERVLDMLQRTLPVELQSFTRYWVTVRGRYGASQGHSFQINQKN